MIVGNPTKTISSAANQKLNGSRTIAIVVEIRTSYSIAYLTCSVSVGLTEEQSGYLVFDAESRITFTEVRFAYEDLGSFLKYKGHYTFYGRVARLIRRGSAPATSVPREPGENQFCNCATVARKW
jgi:hypothetical protein